jgi:hypothetical protein
MPALVAGIHAYDIIVTEGVDGRDKPGHDAGPYRISHQFRAS